jgi:hypothetical protein
LISVAHTDVPFVPASVLAHYGAVGFLLDTVEKDVWIHRVPFVWNTKS